MPPCHAIPSMSAKCRQDFRADSDTNGQDAWLLEQLPHDLASSFPRRPAAHCLPYLTLFDSVIVPHQFSQGVQGEYTKVTGDYITHITVRDLLVDC